MPTQTIATGFAAAMARLLTDHSVLEVVWVFEDIHSNHRDEDNCCRCVVSEESEVLIPEREEVDHILLGGRGRIKRSVVSRHSATPN